jgi:hypothetical protein
MQHLVQELKRLATPSAKPHISAPTISTSKMQPPSDQKEECIMLCLDHQHPPLVTVHEIKLSTAPSNTELFLRLAKEYEERREPYIFLTIKVRPFWRQVRAIHFVRFTTLSPQPGMTAQIEDMHGLPHETHSWVWNRRNGVDASIMARYLQEPSSVSEGWSIYEYIPKTRYPDLLPRKPGSGGWGLYMEEGVSRRSKLMCLIALLTIVYLLEVWEMVQMKEVLGIIVISVNFYYVGGIVAAA